MVREELIASAVSFLQDPSVASAPVEKRIAFLQSKNLTQEEIDVSLARVGEQVTSTSTPPPATPSSPAPQNYAYKQAPPPPNYGAYPPPGYWQQPPPPELPKRDWRDWFIMATVMGGVGYGLYFTAKRYIVPLIKPPTPPQLEQDKTAIDEQFTRAFALLDQLSSDTTALKASEETRTQRLDNAIADMEQVLASLKESARRRDDDNRRIEDDVRGLRDLIPKALEAHKESADTRLKELGTELKSLKTLVGNRITTGATPIRSPSSTGGSAVGSASVNGSTASQSSTTTNASGSSNGASTDAPASTTSSNTTTTAANTTSSSAPDRAQTSSPYGRFANGRAAIPAWQLAASKNKAQADSDKKDTSESGTAVDASTEATSA